MIVEHLVPVLLIEIAIILVLSRLMGQLFARLNQPQVIGEMVAGILLGPSFLGLMSDLAIRHGWLTFSVSGALFPEESLPFLGVLSQIGVIFFLFLIGLELDPSLLRNKGRTAAVISTASIVAPLLLGVGVTAVLYPRLYGGNHPAGFLGVALFLGAAMSVTAFPVLARILAERNMHRTRIGAVAITCAAFNDVTAWCMLAFVIDIARAEGVGPALTTAVLATIYVVTMFTLVRPFLRRLQSIHDRQGRLNAGAIAVVLGLVLVSAYITERIGIHALFGAFVVGAIMPKGTRFVRTLTERLEDFVVVLLLPIFFAYSGLKTQIGLLNGGEIWMYTLLVIAAACLGKVGGAALSARWCGMPWRESSVLGVLMNTRGLMELVILNIGQQIGVIPPVVFAMMVLMALVTTAMTGPLVHVIYPSRLYAAEVGAGTSESPAGRRRRRVQTGVLIPVADPQSGRPLLMLADLLTARPRSAPAAPSAAGESPETAPTRQEQLGLSTSASPRRRIYALHLRRPMEQEVYDEVAGRNVPRSPAHRSEDASLQPLLEHAEQHDVPVEVISFVSRHISRDIVHTAVDRDVDLVLMGSHRPLVGSAVLGGTVHKVLRRSPTNVAILLHRGMTQIQRILVPYMGGSHDRLAMEMASKLGRSAGAQVTVLHVVPENRDGETALGAAGAVENVFTNQDPDQPAPVEFRVVRDNDPVEAALREAQGFDLVIVGMGEEWGLESHRFRFRRERFAAESPCPLLLVRKAAKQAKREEEEMAEPIEATPAQV